MTTATGVLTDRETWRAKGSSTLKAKTAMISTIPAWPIRSPARRRIPATTAHTPSSGE